MPFFDKELSKTIVTRAKLRNNFLQNKCEENRKLNAKQRNFCISLLWKVKKRNYETLNEKSVIDDKLFWKAVSPFLSDKIVGKSNIHLTENGELTKQDLDIQIYSNNKLFLDNVNDSTIKSILKCRNHPSIVAIRNQCENRASFSFSEVDKKFWKFDFESGCE